jgi:hypothetical protein
MSSFSPTLPAHIDWTQDDILMTAIPHRHPCIEGWESKNVFNYDWKLINLSDAEFAFIQVCDKNRTEQLTVAEILKTIDFSIADVRSLLDRKLIMLAK